MNSNSTASIRCSQDHRTRLKTAIKVGVWLGLVLGLGLGLVLGLDYGLGLSSDIRLRHDPQLQVSHLATTTAQYA